MLHDSTGDGSVGDAQGNVAGVGGGTEGQPGAGTNDDGEGARPEAVGKLVEHWIAVARELVGLGQRRDEKGERFLFLPAFQAVDTLDGVEIYRVDGQAVKGVGRHGNDVALAQARDDVVDPVWLWFVGMDAQDFRGQEGLPQYPNCTDHNDGSYHSTSRGASFPITMCSLRTS